MVYSQTEILVTRPVGLNVGRTVQDHHHYKVLSIYLQCSHKNFNLICVPTE